MILHFFYRAIISEFARIVLFQKYKFRVLPPYLTYQASRVRIQNKNLIEEQGGEEVSSVQRIHLFHLWIVMDCLSQVVTSRFDLLNLFKALKVHIPK